MQEEVDCQLEASDTIVALLGAGLVEKEQLREGGWRQKEG